jgi:Insertion element 4 transposase N-terminal/Transposase DDE domain
LSLQDNLEPGAPLSAQIAITRTIRVAAGAFAPGHLGELTQLVPFDMVDAVLAETRAVQARIRDVPARVAVYLLLAGCLFAELGYPGVWQRLVAGLHGIAVATPTAAALGQARRRLGVTPLRALFELLASPAAGIRTPGVRWRDLLVCAIDGTTMTVPDSPATLTRYRKHRCNHGGSGYPQLRLTALVACGTRTLLDAVFTPTTTGELSHAHQLTRSLRPGMIVLLDRYFGVPALLGALADTGAQLLVRLKTSHRLPVLRRFRDGSYLTRLGGLSGPAVRVVECEITIATAAGRHTGVYRLATTLTDPYHYPAGELVTLYHQRWEIETAYLEIKSSILGNRVLRARTPAGVDQEVYALLTTYQILRLAMADATTSRPGLDPDRASFTIALYAARDQLVQAAGVIADTTIDLVGAIGRQVLANLLPDRRLRVNPRNVKRAISKYNAKGRVDRTSYKATLSIDILAPPSP